MTNELNPQARQFIAAQQTARLDNILASRQALEDRIGYSSKVLTILAHLEELEAKEQAAKTVDEIRALLTEIHFLRSLPLMANFEQLEEAQVEQIDTIYNTLISAEKEELHG